MSTLRDNLADLPKPTDAGLPEFIEQMQAAQLDERPPRHPGCTHGVGPLVALQPHPDDVALSVGGIVVQLPVPLTIVTVYSQALDPAATPRRQIEDQDYATAVGAQLRRLPFQERPSISEQRTSQETTAALARIADVTDPTGSLVMGPAGVARHVDHVAVHTMGRHIDQPVLFWEDVAFWSIYGASIEDRVLFSERHPGWLSQQVLVAVDITPVARLKAALLRCYRSQSDERWRPLRYAWSAARELGHDGYCERLFVPAGSLDRTLAWLGAKGTEGAALQYGSTSLPTVWAAITTETS